MQVPKCPRSSHSEATPRQHQGEPFFRVWFWFPFLPPSKLFLLWWSWLLLPAIVSLPFFVGGQTDKPSTTSPNSQYSDLSIVAISRTNQVLTSLNQDFDSVAIDWETGRLELSILLTGYPCSKQSGGTTTQKSGLLYLSLRKADESLSRYLNGFSHKLTHHSSGINPRHSSHPN